MSQEMMQEYGITLRRPSTCGRRHISHCDCRVNLNNVGKGKQVVFNFYNGVESRIAGNSQYITYGLNGDKSRVYFVATVQHNGFKLCVDSDTRREIKHVVPSNEYAMWAAWNGYYYLRYDKRVNCYYIDIKEKVIDGVEFK